MVSCELWGINRWLRYSGWRLFVTIDTPGTPETAREPTRIGLKFYGWKSIKFDRSG